MEPQTTSFWAEYSLEIVTIIAIVLGPILAVQTQKILEARKADKQRKIDIFKTLMATRGTVLNPAHIQALNLIDIEFYKGAKYEDVLDAWKEYLDNLGKPLGDTPDANQIWRNQNDDLLANLLHKMGKSLGYKFDKVQIKRNSYNPQGNADAENDLNFIRRGLASMIKEGGIPIYNAFSTKEDLKKQAEIQELLHTYLKNPLNVKILNGEETPKENNVEADESEQ